MFCTNLANRRYQLNHCRRCYFHTSSQLAISPLYPFYTERAIIKVSILEQKLVGQSLTKEKHHHIITNLLVKL